MKKWFMLIVVVVTITSITVAQSDNWVSISTPPSYDGEQVFVTADGQILAKVGQKLFSSFDKGENWMQIPAPPTSDFVFETEFLGKVYCYAQSGVYSAIPGQNWKLANIQIYPYTMCAGEGWIYVFGRVNSPVLLPAGYRSSDGITWEKLSSIFDYKGDFFWNCAMACGGSVMVTKNPPNTLWYSYYEGVHWGFTDTLDIIPYSRDYQEGEFCLIGSLENGTSGIRSGRGNLDLPFAMLAASPAFFKNTLYVGGIIQNNLGQPIKGFIFKDNNPSGAKEFSSPIFQLASNHTSTIVAATMSGKMYVLQETLGTEDQFQAESVQVYPNPTNGKVTVTSSSGKVQLFNQMGQKIFEGYIPNSKSELDLSNLAPGIYFLVTREKTSRIIKY